MKSSPDKRYGALYGTAIGDALGIPYEQMKAPEVLSALPGGQGPFTYTGVSRDNGDSWAPGEWSDDTEQALCILDAQLMEGNTEEQNLAQKLAHWYKTNPRGCGGHTRKVITHPSFLKSPVEASQEVWAQAIEEDKDKLFANGGVMRTSAVGILRPWNLDWTAETAMRMCIVTHYDKSCAASAMAISVLIACLVQGWKPEYAIEEATQRAFKCDAGVIPFTRVTSLEALGLDEGFIGYTYKAMGVAFWALRDFQETQNFRETITSIIRAGGDTDTNAAVAGGVLGALVGLKSLPQTLCEGLVDKARLHTLVTRTCMRGQIRL